MPRLDLVARCDQCAALCCTYLAFDAGPAFAFSKPAGEVCRHVTRDHRCRIHARLAERGFAGCAAYDCHGAGQRATRLFATAVLDEQDRHDLFALLREVHELLWRLDGAAAYADTSAELAALDAAASSIDTLRAADLVPARALLRRIRRTMRP